MLSATFFVPHPPVIIPGIGNQDNLQKVIGTRSSLKKLGARVKNINPDTLIFLTPHAPINSNSMSVNKETDLEGDFMDFGFLGWGKSKKNNLDLVNKIKAKLSKENVSLTEFKTRLDH